MCRSRMFLYICKSHVLHTYNTANNNKIKFKETKKTTTTNIVVKCSTFTIYRILCKKKKKIVSTILR